MYALVLGKLTHLYILNKWPTEDLTAFVKDMKAKARRMGCFLIKSVKKGKQIVNKKILNDCMDETE